MSNILFSNFQRVPSRLVFLHTVKLVFAWLSHSHRKQQYFVYPDCRSIKMSIIFKVTTEIPAVLEVLKTIQQLCVFHVDSMSYWNEGKMVSIMQQDCLETHFGWVYKKLPFLGVMFNSSDTIHKVIFFQEIILTFLMTSTNKVLPTFPLRRFHCWSLDPIISVLAFDSSKLQTWSFSSS